MPPGWFLAELKVYLAISQNNQFLILVFLYCFYSPSLQAQQAPAGVAAEKGLDGIFTTSSLPFSDAERRVRFDTRPLAHAFAAPGPSALPLCCWSSASAGLSVR